MRTYSPVGTEELLGISKRRRHLLGGSPPTCIAAGDDIEAGITGDITVDITSCASDIAAATAGDIAIDIFCEATLDGPGAVSMVTFP